MALLTPFKLNLKVLSGITLILCLIIAVLLFLFGPRTVYSQPVFKKWVQSQVSSQSQADFTFEKIKGGIFQANLTKLRLNLKATKSNIRLVDTPELSASFAWLPLLENKLILKSLTMHGGKLQIELNGSAPEQIRFPVGSDFKLNDGSLSLINFSGWNVQLKNCDFRAQQSGPDSNPTITGSLYAKEGQIGNLKLTEIESDFQIESGQLFIKNLQAILPGKSEITLNGHQALTGNKSLQFELKVVSPQLLPLVKALDFSDRFSGRAEISLNAQGTFTPTVRRLKGSGEAILKDVRADVILPRFPAFNNAPILARVDELSDLNGKALFQLDQQNILVTDLNLKNKDVIISGTAQIGYDRSLSSNLLFVGNKTVGEEIPSFVRSTFKYDEQGNVTIPFSLQPSTREPQVDVGNLVNQLMGNPLKTLNPLNFFQ